MSVARCELGHGLFGEDGFVDTAADVERAAGDFLGAAGDGDLEEGPPVSAGPHLGHVHVPLLVGTVHSEIAGPALRIPVPGRLQQPVRVSVPWRGGVRVAA